VYPKASRPIAVQYQPYTTTPGELLTQLITERNSTRVTLAARIKRARHAAAKSIKRKTAAAVRLAENRAAAKFWSDLGEKLTAIDDAYQKAAKTAFDDALRLALDVTRAVVGTACLDEASIASRIKDELSSLAHTRSAVTVNDQQLRSIRTELERLGIKLELSGSKDVAPGNAIINVPSGSLELTWERHFDSIIAAVGDTL
jgi:plasmid maintenance system antidote protein VapI